MPKGAVSIQKASRIQYSFRNAVLLTGICSVLTACSWFKDTDELDQSRTLPPLEVPPDLVRPYSSDKLVEPELPGDNIQAKNCQCDDRPPKIGEAVLPVGKGVQRFRDGQHRWLGVSAEPEQVWPLAIEFLERRGYQVDRNDPGLGILETAWKQRFESDDSQTVSNVSERLRFRLEPAQQAGSTEVYLTQYSRERLDIPSSPEKDQWQLREADNERVIEMLNRFARFLAGENIEDAVHAPLQSRLASADENGTGLLVKAELEKVWRRTAIALDALGFIIEDQDRVNRIYRVYNELSRGKTEEELKHGKPESATVREEYRLHLDQDGDSTIISVRDEAEQIDNTEPALHLLNLLHGQFQ